MYVVPKEGVGRGGSRTSRELLSLEHLMNKQQLSPLSNQGGRDTIAPPLSQGGRNTTAPPPAKPYMDALVLNVLHPATAQLIRISLIWSWLLLGT